MVYVKAQGFGVKFSNCFIYSTDTRPLLRFSADTLAIRAVAWAPVGRSVVSHNMLVLLFLES